MLGNLRELVADPAAPYEAEVQRQPGTGLYLGSRADPTGSYIARGAWYEVDDHPLSGPNNLAIYSRTSRRTLADPTDSWPITGVRPVRNIGQQNRTR